MKILAPLLLFLLFADVFMGSGAAQSSYDLRSPDGRIEIRIRTAEQIRYDVVLKGRAVLENSTLSLDVEHKKLGLQPTVIDSKPRSSDQVIEPVVRQKFAKIRDRYNELRLDIECGYALVFRAYNEGAAYVVALFSSAAAGGLRNAVGADYAEVWLERGERVVGDLRPRRRDA